MKQALKDYESDWKQLSPIIRKLTKLVEYFSLEDGEIVFPTYDHIKADYEAFKKQQLHTTQVQRNQLSALTLTVTNLDKNSF
jgi:hypothetical protein